MEAQAGAFFLSVNARIAKKSPIYDFLETICNIQVSVNAPLTDFVRSAPQFPVVLSFMYFFDNFTQPALMYLMLHSVYCWCWLTKHMTFRDKNFDEKVSFPFFLTIFVYVDLYWVGPYMLCKYRRDPYLENWEMCAAILLWGYGVFLHFASDSQKAHTLTYRGRGLITSGLFSWVRNPNYLGETLIYMAYALLTKSKVAWAILASFILITFVPNMIKKDKSLEKYGEDFVNYKKKTWVMIPFIY